MQSSPISAVSQSRALAPVLFTATIFLSASLLFFVQPLFTKIVLPRIGGSPAVWTTAMLFFQLVLIAGYLYAHLLTRHLSVRAQMVVHLGVWAGALLFLPLTVPQGWQFDPAGAVAWQTLLLFAAGVGLPFFALSANAPLIQFWYARSGGPSASDPYFLYGASNLGSLTALLGFPLLAAPFLGAASIGLGWACGFVALGGFLLASGLQARESAAVERPARARHAASDRPGAADFAWWALLAFVPSSLMLAVTSKVSLDVGAVPLVWVVPLSLYLLSFVVTFSNRAWPRLPHAETGMTVVLVVMLVLLGGTSGKHLSWLSVGVLIAGFFLVALHAHRKLYEARPESAHLTAFYLTMSVGGALGGLFNSIIGPVLFSGLYEGVATLLVARLLMLGIRERLPQVPGALLRGAAVAGLAAVPALAGWAVLEIEAVAVLLALLAVPGLVVLFWLGQDRVAGFGAAVTLLVAALTIWPDTAQFRDRSFFGTHIVANEDGMRIYGNGTTVHGAQRLSDDGQGAAPEPLFYYHRNGPMAQVMTSGRGRAAHGVGIVGLGVGSLACYRQPHQEWQFYEIDPMVDMVARTPHLFRFVSDCAPEAPTHLGDARIVLEDQVGHRYDILVIDAYSSDSVPVHLTTNEAIALYMERLAPGGVLVFHISNRYYEIERPLARSAEAQGLVARLQDYAGNSARDPGDSPSKVVIMARDLADLGDLAEDPRWQSLESDGGRLWTDDYANLLSILK